MENIQIPHQITVRLVRDNSGFVAELPEYNAHTEAEDIYELFYQVNDLIYSIFDIAPEFRKFIKYIPESGEKFGSKIPSSVFVKKYISSDAKSLFC